MDVAVIDMYKDNIGSLNLIEALHSIGIKPTVFHIDKIIKQKINLVDAIAQSPIKHWIFTGSAQSIYEKDSPQIPINIFKIPGKRFFLICYSMESALKQLGCSVTKRYINRREYFKLHVQKTKVLLSEYSRLFENIPNPAIYWRNHHYYTPSNNMNKQIYEVASYRGELMVAFYKNAVLTQFHPERSAAGKRLLQNWAFTMHK